jgi:ribosomal protein S3AE
VWIIQITESVVSFRFQMWALCHFFESDVITRSQVRSRHVERVVSRVALVTNDIKSIRVSTVSVAYHRVRDRQTVQGS